MPAGGEDPEWDPNLGGLQQELCGLLDERYYDALKFSFFARGFSFTFWTWPRIMAGIHRSAGALIETTRPGPRSAQAPAHAASVRGIGGRLDEYAIPTVSSVASASSSIACLWVLPVKELQRLLSQLRQASPCHRHGPSHNGNPHCRPCNAL